MKLPLSQQVIPETVIRFSAFLKGFVGTENILVFVLLKQVKMKTRIVLQISNNESMYE